MTTTAKKPPVKKKAQEPAPAKEKKPNQGRKKSLVNKPGKSIESYNEPVPQQTIQEKKEALHIAPHHISISTFAKRKQVTRAAVHNHITAGHIIPDIIGEKMENPKEQIQLIDWSIYKDYKFGEPKFKIHQ